MRYTVSCRFNGSIEVEPLCYELDLACLIATTERATSWQNANLTGIGDRVRGFGSRIELAYARSNPSIVYANFDSGSGIGSGIVIYSVAGNTGGARVGTITVSGQTFTVKQKPQ